MITEKLKNIINKIIDTNNNATREELGFTPLRFTKERWDEYTIDVLLDIESLEPSYILINKRYSYYKLIYNIKEELLHIQYNLSPHAIDLPMGEGSCLIYNKEYFKTIRL